MFGDKRSIRRGKLGWIPDVLLRVRLSTGADDKPPLADAIFADCFGRQIPSRPSAV